MDMNVVVTGATGFVGSALVRALVRDHRVVALARDPAKARKQLATALETQVNGKPDGKGPSLTASITAVGLDDAPGLRAALASADAIINLAGENLFDGRWTDERKRALRASRIATTERVVKALADSHGAHDPRESRDERPAARPLPVLVSASAVGFYGDAGDRLLDEHSPPSHGGVAGADFAAELCRDWEAAALAARPRTSRVVLGRFGIILGRHGGALDAMRPLFRAGLGGRLGSGDQWVSWIHLDDVIAALLALLPGGKHDSLDGPVNFTAPAPASNRQLTEALGQALHRPTVVPAPAFALSLALGERAGMLLASQRVIPQALTAAGFAFRYAALAPAVADAVAP
jgi:uncharacterized protein